MDRRVLIVDEATSDTEGLAAALRALGCATVALPTAAALCETVEAWRPDLVLLDPATRGADVIEAVRALRARANGASVPIVALGANADLPKVQTALDAGCTLYVTKPADERVLREVIGRLTRRATA